MHLRANTIIVDRYRVLYKVISLQCTGQADYRYHEYAIIKRVHNQYYSSGTCKEDMDIIDKYYKIASPLCQVLYGS